MFDLLFYLKELVSVLAIVFCVVTFCESIQSDSTLREAAKKVWVFLGARLHERLSPNYIMSKDFFDEMWETYTTLAGEQQYNQICKLACSNKGETFLARTKSSLSSIVRMSFYTADDNERHRLESALTTIVTKYLALSGYDTRILVAWKKRKDFDMDVLEVRYAINKEQQKKMDYEFESRSKKIIAKSAAVTDDTEEVDLF